jgi:hypothetical protein
LFLLLESRFHCVSYYNFRGLGLQPYSFASNLDIHCTDFSRYATPCIYKSLILHVIRIYANVVYKRAAHLSKQRTFSSVAYAPRRSIALQQIPILYVIR